MHFAVLCLETVAISTTQIWNTPRNSTSSLLPNACIISVKNESMVPYTWRINIRFCLPHSSYRSFVEKLSLISLSSHSAKQTNFFVHSITTKDREPHSRLLCNTRWPGSSIQQYMLRRQKKCIRPWPIFTGQSCIEIEVYSMCVTTPLETARGGGGEILQFMLISNTETFPTPLLHVRNKNSRYIT